MDNVGEKKNMWEEERRERRGKRTGTRANTSLRMEMGFQRKPGLAELGLESSLSVTSMQNLVL